MLIMKGIEFQSETTIDLTKSCIYATYHKLRHYLTLMTVKRNSWCDHEDCSLNMLNTCKIIESVCCHPDELSALHWFSLQLIFNEWGAVNRADMMSPGYALFCPNVMYWLWNPRQTKVASLLQDRLIFITSSAIWRPIIWSSSSLYPFRNKSGPQQSWWNEKGLGCLLPKKSVKCGQGGYTLFSERSAHENHPNFLRTLGHWPRPRVILILSIDKIDMTLGQGQWPRVTGRTTVNQCALLLEKSVGYMDMVPYQYTLQAGPFPISSQ